MGSGALNRRSAQYRGAGRTVQRTVRNSRARQALPSGATRTQMRRALANVNRPGGRATSYAGVARANARRRTI